MPQKKQPQRSRLWLSDGSCIRLRAAHQDHVWSYDSVAGRVRDGRAFRMLTIIDLFRRECLAIDVASKLKSEDVLERLSDLFACRGVPKYLRSERGPEFVAQAVTRWLYRASVKTLFIANGSPWENGYVESFNARFRDELLNRELFVGLEDARWIIDQWRLDFNHQSPHSSLDYQTPAEFAARWLASAPKTASAVPQQPSPLRQASGSLPSDPLIKAGT